MPKASCVMNTQETSPVAKQHQRRGFCSRYAWTSGAPAGFGPEGRILSPFDMKASMVRNAGPRANAEYACWQSSWAVVLMPALCTTEALHLPTHFSAAFFFLAGAAPPSRKPFLNRRATCLTYLQRKSWRYCRSHPPLERLRVEKEPTLGSSMKAFSSLMRPVPGARLRLDFLDHSYERILAAG